MGSRSAQIARRHVGSLLLRLTRCPLPLPTGRCSKYLADDSVDVRTATENVLADFLREIREIAKIKKQQTEQAQARILANGGAASGEHSQRPLRRRQSKTTMDSSAADSERASWAEEEEADGFGKADGDDEDESDDEDWEGKGSGSWIPGQGVVVPYAEIVEILLSHVTYPSESTAPTCRYSLSLCANLTHR